MLICHTVTRSKVAITIDEGLLARVDALVKEERFKNRSRAIEEAVAEKMARLERTQLARECAKLDPVFEQSLADEGLNEEELAEWPEY